MILSYEFLQIKKMSNNKKKDKLNRRIRRLDETQEFQEKSIE